MRLHCKLILLLLLSLPATMLQAKTPSPADYSVAVHVTSSEFTAGAIERLVAVIDGKTYFLMGSSGGYALRVGNYKARIILDKSVRAEQYLRVYEFLFQDGKTDRFTVAGESE